MQLLPQEFILMRLKGLDPQDFYPEAILQRVTEQVDHFCQKSEEECFDLLRKISGLNFGSDLDLWEEWARKSVERFGRRWRFDYPPLGQEEDDDASAVYYLSPKSVSPDDIDTFFTERSFNIIEICFEGRRIFETNEPRFIECSSEKFERDRLREGQVEAADALGPLNMYYICYHEPDTDAMMEVLAGLLQRHGGWIANDTDDLQPMFDVSAIGDFRYP